MLEGDILLIDTEVEENDIENYLITNLWNVANETIKNFFYSLTLEDLAEGYRNKGKDDMYYI